MMNNTHCMLSSGPSRRFEFGSWAVSIARSPKRTDRWPTSFQAGVRWAALGALVSIAMIAAASAGLA